MKYKFEVAVVVAFWLACSLYSWGTINAEYISIHEEDSWLDYPPQAPTVGELLAGSVMGPFSAAAAAIATDGNAHGWTLRSAK